MVAAFWADCSTILLCSACIPSEGGDTITGAGIPSQGRDRCHTACRQTPLHAYQALINVLRETSRYCEHPKRGADGVWTGC
eukprot:scaffold29961_cov16-Tisochrysis_lutea.AAC.1